MDTPLTRQDEPSLAFGGQALIEGVMMRSSTHIVMCVRQPNNEIVTQVEEIKSLTKKHRILGLPFLRGIIVMLETMYYGVKGLFFSANVALEEEEDQITSRELLLVLVIVLAISSLFIVVPFLLTTFLNLTGMLFNIVEAAIRLSLFILYIYLVSRWGEFRRVLQYHGAEHKTINAYESEAALNVENVSKFSRLNPRCGTSFLFIVMIVSVALFSMIPKTVFYMRIAYRMILIPVLGAISYELLKLSNRYRNSSIMKIITAPGLAFQRLTTKEPDNDMIEVAVKALEEVKKLSGS
jgi:uncharacterized protein YqhQ